jgi:phage shock protein B
MNAVFIIAIIFGGIILALAVVGGTILMAIKLRHEGMSRHDQQTQAEEARMIQEIYSGLERLEQRVESLETILMDRKERDQQT